MEVIYHKVTETVIVRKDGREIYLVREGFGNERKIKNAFEFNALIPDTLDIEDPIIDEILAELGGKQVQENGNEVVKKKRGRRTKAQILADQQRMLQEA